MKKILMTVAALGGIALFAGDALAASDAYCRNYAQNEVNRYANPVGSAALGCVGGGIIGSLLSNGNGGAVAGGCVAGGATTLVLTDAKRRQIFDQAYNQCRYGNAGPAQPIYAPIPAGSARVKTTANVRSTPQIAPYNIITQVSGGSIVPVTSCNGYGWCSIALGNGSGWIAQSLLQF
jgi:hypothetical protein